MYGEEEVLLLSAEGATALPPTTTKAARPNLAGVLAEKGGSLSSSSLVLPVCPLSSMVGMPLSEMPSFVPSSTSSSVNAKVDGEEEPIRRSELRCRCLKLVLPLPEDAEGGGRDDGNGSRSS